MPQLIIGNWKMNGTRGSAVELVEALSREADSVPGTLVVCPPFTLVALVARTLAGTRVAVGAQDCHAEISGAYTGDIAAPMLVEAGARYVILGHSERRHYHNETSAEVHAKTKAALAAGLIPIVCVGESEEQRRNGAALTVVGRQLTESLPEGFKGIVAYEPIWAIGTGLTPTLEDVAAMHSHMRVVLASRFGAAGSATPLLYGGSVKPSNAAELLAVKDVGGALIGGASLVAKDFLAIARAAK